ncbi:molecular chaperone TorD family protein [Pseudodesulfovibrio thermohalotolerans]|uniref:TorD/DmsD family molecular chaperone n=1 Tax=Pseudodesulfovibrio thermohalotolerans TaxID=2880651 RepID=UPI00244324A4|nr:molecular chaperone TorD family protein [Pseudodesulfovibrio thermohalotolerans]WFS63154.1 molecular chaperone TorD family protein [Pseudodesulfovibrio thermohalotolerans]
MPSVERHAGQTSVADANGTTALGSFLRFVGVACNGFNIIAGESGRPVLVQAGSLSGSWRAFFENAGLDAPVEALGKDIRVLLEDEDELARTLGEFNALFRVPELPVPLWESVWLSSEKILFTEESFAVRDWYARFQWEINKVGYEAEDHIGFESAFCGWLFDAAVNGEGLARDGHPQPAQSDVRAFLDEHFTRWAPECFRQLADAAETPFWAHLLTSAALLSGALAEDI